MDEVTAAWRVSSLTGNAESKSSLEHTHTGTFLGVQWLTLSASSAGAQVQPLVGELRSHMPYVMYGQGGGGRGERERSTNSCPKYLCLMYDYKVMRLKPTGYMECNLITSAPRHSRHGTFHVHISNKILFIMIDIFSEMTDALFVLSSH